MLNRHLAIVGLTVAVRAIGADAQDASRAPEPPAIAPPRYTEDYSYLRDPANRTGAWWEPLKFIALDSAGRAYLTVGDDVLLEHERYWNNQFGGAAKPDEGYVHFRASPYADLHFGPRFRVFGQVVAAWATRSRRTKTPTDETGSDLLQAFFDFRIPVGRSSQVTLRGGRHVMNYGSGRLIAPRRINGPRPDGSAGKAARLEDRLQLRANRIGGDEDPDDRTLGTFNPLFPAIRYFGTINLLGPANLMNLRAIAGIALGSGWTLSPTAVFYWR